MRKIFVITFVVAINTTLMAQFNYVPTTEHPFGSPNPNAPSEINDYQEMIGLCDCKSITRNIDGNWNDTIEMTWEFKYILNGMAVQDQTLKADGTHSGSIRQFIADSASWYVHYYSSAKPSATLGTWKGRRKDGKIVLYREQKAPNGMEGFYKITFYDISERGFKWLGEWVDKAEKFSFPNWRITCKKRVN